MKSIDLSKPGGMPLTQDVLDYLQTAYREAIGGLAAIGGPGPLIVSGMVVTKTLVTGTTYNYTITDGWVLYNGEMLRVLAGGISGVDESAYDVYVELTRSSSPLTYNDGSTPNVINDVTCGLVTQAIGTVNDASHFLLKGLKPFGRESARTQIIVSTPAADGGVGGYIWYRKNFLNNTLQIEGLLGTSNAQNFIASPTINYYLLTTLPDGYRPSGVIFYTGYVTGFGGNRVKDDLGIGWINEIEFQITNNGGVYAAFVKPDITIPNYGFHFNCIVPLD
jgi:hypothetical protein